MVYLDTLADYGFAYASQICSSTSPQHPELQLKIPEGNPCFDSSPSVILKLYPKILDAFPQSVSKHLKIGWRTSHHPRTLVSASRALEATFGYLCLYISIAVDGACNVLLFVTAVENFSSSL